MVIDKVLYWYKQDIKLYLHSIHLAVHNKNKDKERYYFNKLLTTLKCIKQLEEILQQQD